MKISATIKLAQNIGLIKAKYIIKLREYYYLILILVWYSLLLAIPLFSNFIAVKHRVGAISNPTIFSVRFKDWFGLVEDPRDLAPWQNKQRLCCWECNRCQSKVILRSLVREASVCSCNNLQLRKYRCYACHWWLHNLLSTEMFFS